MPTESNPIPYITLDYFEKKEGILVSEMPNNSIRLSFTVADGLLKAFRRAAIVYGRSDIFPFYFTPLKYVNGEEYVALGKYILLAKDLKKKTDTS